MAFLEWNQEYSVGHDPIDEEHKLLIGMINRAYEALESRTEAEMLAGLVDDMRAYALKHFAHEEQIMVENDYPELGRQKRDHGEFLRRALFTEEELCGQGEADPIAVFRFLADWLKNHILVEDMKLGAFLQQHAG